MRSLTAGRILAAALGAAVFFHRAAWAEPRVEMELVFEPGFPVAGAQRWAAALDDVGAASLRIRQAKAGDRPQIETTGQGEFAVHRVTGVLTAGDRVVLPGGGFSLRDKAQIAQWIAKVKAGGIEELTAPRTAFGLTEKEFVALYERLAAPLELSTKDQRATDCIKAVVRGLGVPVTIENGARPALESDWRVAEELRGLSQGTALAALLRPLGLAFAPQREIGGKVSLKFAAQERLPKRWPVGWPPQGTVHQTAPGLLKQLNVEIADTPLADALSAVQTRLQLPFLFDRNKMARDQIDPAAIPVSFPAGRTYYKRILDRLLAQAKLKAELRVDEAGKPFLWITSIRP